MRPKFFSLNIYIFHLKEKEGEGRTRGCGVEPWWKVESGNTGGAVVWCVKGGTPGAHGEEK